MAVGRRGARQRGSGRRRGRGDAAVRASWRKGGAEAAERACGAAGGEGKAVGAGVGHCGWRLQLEVNCLVELGTASVDVCLRDRTSCEPLVMVVVAVERLWCVWSSG